MIHFGIFKFEKGNVVYAIGGNGYRLLKFENGEPIELTVYYKPTKDEASRRAVIYRQLKYLKTGQISKITDVDTIFDIPVSREMFRTILCDCVINHNTVEVVASIFGMWNHYVLYDSSESIEWSVDPKTCEELKNDFELLSQTKIEKEGIPDVDLLENWMKAYLTER